ncbi:calcium-binding protein [Pseudoalteromonas espejiana]
MFKNGSFGLFYEVDLYSSAHQTLHFNNGGIDKDIFEIPNIKGYGYLPNLWTAMSYNPALKELIQDIYQRKDIDFLKNSMDEVLTLWANSNPAKPELLNINNALENTNGNNEVYYKPSNELLTTENLELIRSINGLDNLIYEDGSWYDDKKLVLRGNAYKENLWEIKHYYYKRFITSFNFQIADKLELDYSFQYDSFYEIETPTIEYQYSLYKAAILNSTEPYLTEAFLNKSSHNLKNVRELIFKDYLKGIYTPENLANIRIKDKLQLFPVNIIPVTSNHTLASQTNSIRKTESKIIGTYRPDLIIGDEHDNSIFSGMESDFVDGGPRNDKISGGFGDDWLYGNIGDDKLHGGLGNDFLDGGAGNDEMSGGPGSDTFKISSNSGVDTIFQYQHSSKDNDKVLFSELNDANTLSVFMYRKDLILSHSNGVVMIKNWFKGTKFQLDTFEFKGGLKITKKELFQMHPINILKDEQFKKLQSKNMITTQVLHIHNSTCQIGLEQNHQICIDFSVA